MVARILRMISFALCLVAVAWFVTFVVEQSKGASAHQQAELNESAPVSQRTPMPAETTSAKPKEGALHKAVDSAFAQISSPFSAATSGMGSQWSIHIVDTLLALLIYGIGLGYLARLLRLTT